MKNSSEIVKPIRSPISYLQKNATIITPHEQSGFNNSKKDLHGEDMFKKDVAYTSPTPRLENKIPVSSARTGSMYNSPSLLYTETPASTMSRAEKRFDYTSNELPEKTDRVDKHSGLLKGTGMTRQDLNENGNETIASRKKRLGLYSPLNEDTETKRNPQNYERIKVAEIVSPSNGGNNDMDWLKGLRSSGNLGTQKTESYVKSPEKDYKRADIPRGTSPNMRKRFYEQETEKILTTTREELNQLNAEVGFRSNNDTTYSKEYVEQLKRRQANQLNELEGKYHMVCKEYEEYRSIQKKKEEDNMTRMESMKRQYEEDIQNIAHSLSNDKENIAIEYEQEIRILKNKNRDLEHEITSINHRLAVNDNDFRNLENSTKIALEEKEEELLRANEEIQRLKDQNSIEIKLLMEGFEREKLKVREEYEMSINELSVEVKQIYEKTAKELEDKDEKMKILEARITQKERMLEETKRTYMIKLEGSAYDIENLTETNKHQKKIIEANHQEILKLNSELEDKKKQLLLFEAKLDLLESDKRKLEQTLKEYRNERLLYGTNASTHFENIHHNKGNSGGGGIHSPKRIVNDVGDNNDKISSTSNFGRNGLATKRNTNPSTYTGSFYDTANKY